MKTERRTEMIWHAVLILIVFLSLYPIFFALSTSFKTLNEAFNSSSLIPKEFTTAAYANVLQKIPFVKITANTFIIASIVTAFKLITGVLAAYSFVFFEYKGKNFMYFILVSTIFIPFTVTMIPNFITISKIGLRDNILGGKAGEGQPHKYPADHRGADGETGHSFHRNHFLHQFLERVRVAVPDLKVHGELHPVPGAADVRQRGGRHGYPGGNGYFRSDHAAAPWHLFRMPEIHHQHIRTVGNQRIEGVKRYGQHSF